MDLQHKFAISETHKNEPPNMPKEYISTEIERECLVQKSNFNLSLCGLTVAHKNRFADAL